MNFKKIVSGLLVVGNLFFSSFWHNVRCVKAGDNICFASEHSENVVNCKDKCNEWFNNSKMVEIVFFGMLGITLATAVVDLISRALHAAEMFRDIKKDIKGSNKSS